MKTAKDFLINRFGKEAYDFGLDNLQPVRPSFLIALMEEYAEQQINLTIPIVSNVCPKCSSKDYNLGIAKRLYICENCEYTEKANCC